MFLHSKDRQIPIIVQDYKNLNQYTIKDKMPLLLIGEVINKLKNVKYFNKLDLIYTTTYKSKKMTNKK